MKIGGESPAATVVDASTPRRLRIAVLNRNFDPTGGGAERYSIALVEQLAARHEIHVFAQTIRHQHPGVTYHTISTPMARPRWINQLWYAFATWRATRKGFDVVHSHENTWHGLVQTVHVLPIRYNLFVGRSGWQRALRWVKVATSPRLLAYLWLERRRYAPLPGRRIVVTSNSLKAIMAATHSGTVPMLDVITPGVSGVPGAAPQGAKLAARRSLGVPESANVLLFVANDFKKKGLPTLLEALQQVSPAGASAESREVFLMVVGNAVHAPDFRAQIARLGLASRVVFLGQLVDVSLAYTAADVLVHPTLEDTFGMVVLEAMAHALPVLVSSGEYCGISDLLTDQVNAVILKNPRDPRELALQLRTVLNDKDFRHKLGVAATSFASPYAWSNLSKTQEAIYEKCV